MAKQPVPCPQCAADRVRRWEQARKANGLTEAEWPRPVAPTFADAKTLAEHRRRVHGAG